MTKPKSSLSPSAQWLLFLGKQRYLLWWAGIITLISMGMSIVALLSDNEIFDRLESVTSLLFIAIFFVYLFFGRRLEVVRTLEKERCLMNRAYERYWRENVPPRRVVLRQHYGIDVNPSTHGTWGDASDGN